MTHATITFLSLSNYAMWENSVSSREVGAYRRYFRIVDHASMLRKGSRRAVKGYKRLIFY